MSGFEQYGDYDPEADALYIRLTPAAVARQIQVTPDIVADVGVDGRIVGVEVLYPGENLEKALQWLRKRGEHAAAGLR